MVRGCHPLFLVVIDCHLSGHRLLLVVIGVHWLLLVVISVHYWWSLVLVICHHRILVVIGVEGVSLLSIATLNRRQNHAITLRKETKNIVVDENNQCTLIADLTL